MSNGIENAEQYLSGLCLELNLRLFCDMEPVSDGFPQRILWVEGITVLNEEERNLVCECEEKYCPEEDILENGKEPAFSEQIKYMLEKIKGYLRKLWKKKGR